MYSEVLQKTKLLKWEPGNQEFFKESKCKGFENQILSNFSNQEHLKHSLLRNMYLIIYLHIYTERETKNMHIQTHTHIHTSIYKHF